MGLLAGCIPGAHYVFRSGSRNAERPGRRFKPRLPLEGRGGARAHPRPRPPVLPAGMDVDQRGLPPEGGARPGIRLALSDHAGGRDEHRRRDPLRVCIEQPRGAVLGVRLLQRGEPVGGALRDHGRVLPRGVVAGRVPVPREAPPEACEDAAPREAQHGRGARARQGDPREAPGTRRGAGEAPSADQGLRAADRAPLRRREGALRPAAERGEGATAAGRCVAQGPREGAGRGAVRGMTTVRARPGPLEYKLVIAVREDLNLSKGKMAVQVAHASVAAALEAKANHPKWFHAWMDEGQKKVVVGVWDLEELRSLERTARAPKLPTAIIEDAGLADL